jgi:hypothetical protein
MLACKPFFVSMRRGWMLGESHHARRIAGGDNGLIRYEPEFANNVART